MPIDLDTALTAEPQKRTIAWTTRDVLLYHLSLGAGRSADPLRWCFESDLEVLPTFAMVAGSGISAGEGAAVGTSGLGLSGIDVALHQILHAGQSVRLHRPIPVSGQAVVSRRVTDIFDKGRAALIIVESKASTPFGEPLWTATSQIWARGEGGFGGESGPQGSRETPDRAPDRVIEMATAPDQAFLYRLNGDLNPLHVDPAFARAAGLDHPILHGLASFGMVARNLVEELLEGDATRLRGLEVRFAGMLHPGETIRTEVWTDPDGTWILRATCPERDGAPVFTQATAEVVEQSR